MRHGGLLDHLRTHSRFGFVGMNQEENTDMNAETHTLFITEWNLVVYT